MKSNNKILIKKIWVSILISSFVLSIYNVGFAEWNESVFEHLYRHKYKNEEKLNDAIIEYDEIDDLIFAKNPTMKNAWFVFDVNKDVEDTADIYYEQADALEYTTGDDAADASNAAKAKGLRIQGDNATDDSETKYLTNIQKEKQIILDTKIAFINYHRSVCALEKAEAGIAEIKRQKESAKLNYEMGTMTKTDYLKVENEYKKADAELILARSNVKTYYNNVLASCGYDIKENIQLAPITHITAELVDSRNDYYDGNDAIENNFQYQIYKKKYDNSHSEETKGTNKINIDNAENAIRKDITTKYQQMHDGMVALNTATLAYNYAKDSYDKAENEYNNGTISKKEYLTAKYNMDVARVDGMLKYFDLDILYEQYISAVNGLASAN